MNPYDQAAFGFSQAYAMNMRAADEQRKANESSSDAFAEVLNDNRTDLNYSPTPQNPAPPSEQYLGVAPGSVIPGEPGDPEAAFRAKQKVAKYLGQKGVV